MTAVAERPQTAVAHLKFARMGPRKLRRVADAIRGKSVREALVLLQFAGVFAAEPIEKLLKSGDGVLWLTDRKGRKVGVPVAKVAYVEVDPPVSDRRVGFGIS